MLVSFGVGARWCDFRARAAVCWRFERFSRGLLSPAFRRCFLLIFMGIASLSSGKKNGAPGVVIRRAAK
jgi:hypothetical protein